VGAQVSCYNVDMHCLLRCSTTAVCYGSGDFSTGSNTVNVSKLSRGCHYVNRARERSAHVAARRRFLHNWVSVKTA